MRFILVNGRTPFRRTFCLQCCEPIMGGYLREIGTSMPYCDYECYRLHHDQAALLDERGKAETVADGASKAIGGGQ